MNAPEIGSEERARLEALAARVGRLQVRQRLGLEQDHEAEVFRRGTHFFHLENWYSVHALIRACLRLAGLLERGRRNALAIELREQQFALARLPAAFDGFTLLQLSDLHVDINAGFVDALIERVQGLEYDLCVLTGDYRARTFGPFEATLRGMERLRARLRGRVYAVLGNHDTLRMVPAMEAMGYTVLLNEWVPIERDGAAICLAGIDDAHYYRTESFYRATYELPQDAASILLSHTPEAYRHAAHAGFDLMLSGHTHGGQICLPGGVPLLTDADRPRALARGRWRYHGMYGYTSVGAGSCIVDVRLNCPPEVTLHRLRALGADAQ
ncbi:MAG: metallophosphoesterase [Burkholderiales bacterium]|nr:MAG: metallophosphoesterase [Burkholderiales bacterium]